MSAPDRITRVNEILKREIADLLERDSFMDGSCLISVTKVKTSANLRKATVGISVFGGDEDTKKDAIRFLEKNRKDLQSRISRDVTLKYTPVLTFVLDRTVEEGDRVFALLEEMEKDES
jgi:ribosome-binding factor A